MGEDFAMHEIKARVEDENPFVSVVLQECARMNKLLGEMRKSMAELQLGLAGSLNMSDSMETLLQCLRLGRIPPRWAANAYPSLKALALWFEDLLMRVEQLGRWSKTLDTPASVWISGLFNPMAYITAILQVTARKNDLPLDQMEVWMDITTVTDHETISGPADEGMFIHGCCMEGARWDMKNGCIAESLAKDLHPPMPVINVKGMVYDLVDKTGIFDCPVYITTKRGATFTFVATLKTNEAVNKWVLAGVAIMMSDDIAVA